MEKLYIGVAKSIFSLFSIPSTGSAPGMKYGKATC
jgi:hypothetical protein